ncbi:MAG: hypothetical protein WAU57_15720 [Xanthobacteraceae bacterium]
MIAHGDPDRAPKPPNPAMHKLTPWNVQFATAEALSPSPERLRLPSMSAKNARRRLFVDQLIDLDLDAFARRTTMTAPGGQQRLGFLRRRCFDTPFLEPGDQHPGMEQPRLGPFLGPLPAPLPDTFLEPFFGSFLDSRWFSQCVSGWHRFGSRFGESRESRPAGSKNKEETSGNSRLGVPLWNARSLISLKLAFPNRPNE